MEVSKRYVEITNNSAVPIVRDWVSSLLDDGDLMKYNAYKQTGDYIGTDAEQVSRRKKVPEHIKARPFYNKLRKGILHKRYSMDVNGVRSEDAMWKWAIAPSKEKMIKQDDLYKLQEICVDYDIMFNEADSVADLADAIIEFFGSNKKILELEQFEKSGLESLKERVIKHEVKPGELTGRTDVEGLLQVKSIVYRPNMTAEQKTESVTPGIMESEKEASEKYTAYALGRKTRAEIDKLALKAGLDLSQNKETLINLLIENESK